MKYLRSVLLAALLTSASRAELAFGDPGVSISTGRISVTDGLAPGGRYSLPTLTVSNNGDQASDYEITINYLDDSERSHPPRSWFDVAPSEFELTPGESTAIAASIALPTGASPGSYLALIEAHPVASGTGTTVVAAAATRVEFSVEPSNWFDAWKLKVGRAIDERAPWSYILPGLVLGAFALRAVRRRLLVKINIERRR